MTSADKDLETPETEDFEVVNPRPSALIESLRSFGYSPETALADLLDNSVTAGATTISVHFHWGGPDSYVTILDDGTGMTEGQLRDAMRAGSQNPLDERQATDLGRFGLGLKTASFSQARSLTVASTTKLGTPPAVRRWDLDHVGQSNSWSLLKSAPTHRTGDLEILTKLNHGTLVLWDKLDRLVDDRPVQDDKAKQTFFAVVDRVRRHIEMVFHRLIAEDGLKITVNEQECVPWDPFFTSHPKTEKQPKENKQITTPDGTVHNLVIQPYVLPHRSELSQIEQLSGAGPKGWNLQQGFYLYRARRLIVAGDWFNPQMKPEEHHKLARIRVEITQEMDADWGLDVRKSRARPPAILKDDFKRIAQATRLKAEHVYRHRGRRSIGGSAPGRRRLIPVWQIEAVGKTVEYQVNRSHEVIKQYLDSLTGEALKEARAVLHLIEHNVPVAHILSQGFRDEDKLPMHSQEITPELRQTLQKLFCALLAAGHKEESAKEIIMSNQPFDQQLSSIEALDPEDCP